MSEAEWGPRVEEVLARRCSTWWWPLAVFLLTTSPGLFNAMHITVYVFISDTPPHLCRLPQLLQANWTLSQIRNISSPGGLTRENSCSYYKWNYTELAELGYEESVRRLSGRPRPATESCQGHLYEEASPAHSVVSQWDLVCDREHLKSSVQVSVALGKFIGALLFGIIADRVGRRRCFVAAGILYMVAGPAAAFLNSFLLFLAVRLLIGVAGSAIYETGYTLVTELTVGKTRTQLSCVYGLFYPVGMVTLALVGSQLHHWRLIQLYISLPALLLLINCWFLPESPRWLLIHGRETEAWKILNEKSDTVELQNKIVEPFLKQQTVETTGEHVWYKKTLVFLKESLRILTHWELRYRALICCFSWFVASLCYYAIALNANNFSGSRYWYVALSGLFEAPGYLLPIPLLAYFGRKSATVIAFLSSGLALLSILLFPPEASGLVLAASMVGRFCVSSVFSVISLHTSELFPTSNRNTAFGLSLTTAQLGSVAAPYVVDVLGKQGWYLPSTVCGSLAVIAGSLVLLLPETKDKPLTDTIQELTASTGRKSNCCSFKS